MSESKKNNSNIKTKDKTQKILFLYLRTGGGHLSCAKTLSGCISKKYGAKAECVLVDVIKESKFGQYILEDGYRISQDGLIAISNTAYALNLIKGVAKTTVTMFTGLSKSYLKKVFLKEKPDKVVVLHALIIHPAEMALEELGMKIPVIVTITDPYTVHPLWLTGKKTHYIVCSDTARRTLTKKGIPKKSITQFPYFVNEKYCNKLSQTQVLEVKKRLGFSPNKKLILVMGGGDGMPKGDTLMKGLVKYIKKHALDVDIAMVCGNNLRLKKYCTILARKNSKSINMKVYGFIDFVYNLVNASDFVITKAGPATLTEILLLGKIPIINSYIWGQEKGNVAFVVKNKLGFYRVNNSKIPPLIYELMTNDKMRQKISQNIIDLKLKNGTSQMSEFIYKYRN
jgi:UDP-N-acetylglucosamine:LPS N-acetylglucosamine transferase